MPAAAAWRQPRPVRHALSEWDVGDADRWTERLRADRREAAANQTSQMASITATIEARSRDVGARAVLLSGSTARGRRTTVSDLDYHVIGPAPRIDDLADEVDLYSDSPNRFAAKLRAGDDFAHWSVWYGRVLFDDGIVHEAARHLATRDGWPDPIRKLRQAQRALPFAERLVDSGDHSAALEQVRGVLSLTARWMLLAHDIFPLARDELSDQARDLGCFDLAAALDRSIHVVPQLDELATGLRLCRHLTNLSPKRARRARLPAPA